MGERDKILIEQARRWWGARLSRWQEWRHFLHQHPELAFSEEITSAFVAERLSAFGLKPERGWAKTGVVARCEGELGSGPTVLLRADIDGLPIVEQNAFAYRSQIEGQMHACGHDGHTTILLAAAEVLSEQRDFAGTVVFCFQPAEESGGGARLMIEEGVLKRHGVEEVYALHNWPGLPVGSFAVHPGAVMAGAVSFDLVWRGRGGHAAMPERSTDLVVAASQFVTLAQSVVSRQLPPTEAAVFSVTLIQGGTTYNVLPSEVRLAGTVRGLSEAVLKKVRGAVEQLAASVAEGVGAKVAWEWHEGYPPTVNDRRAAAAVAATARRVVGEEQVAVDLAPSMGAEDFSFFLRERPGAYVWLGNGPSEGGRVLHGPYYDFNDEALLTGVAFWWQLVHDRCRSGRDNA